MPRACPVEPHVCSYLAANVNSPRPKAVASSPIKLIGGVATKREIPRDKPVASFFDFLSQLLVCPSLLKNSHDLIVITLNREL